LTKSSASGKFTPAKKVTKTKVAGLSQEVAASKQARMQRDALTAYVKGNDLVLLTGKKLKYLSPRSK
jgi:hypothetical protein